MRTHIVGFKLKPLYIIVGYFEYHVVGHALRTFHVFGVLVSTLIDDGLTCSQLGSIYCCCNISVKA